MIIVQAVEGHCVHLCETLSISAMSLMLWILYPHVVDIIYIPGATLKQLKHALEIEYRKTGIPQDVLVVACSIDIMWGYLHDRIINDMLNILF